MKNPQGERGMDNLFMYIPQILRKPPLRATQDERELGFS
jgi:hypothetical protein